MGTLQEFNCGKCGYAEVVSGGRDRGFLSETVTVACLECAQLHDVIIEEDKLEVFEVSGIEIAGLKCPDNPRHTLTEWTFPGPCPACGAEMETGGILVNWD